MDFTSNIWLSDCGINVFFLLFKKFKLDKKNLRTLIKMCQAIVFYNKNRSLKNEQFFVRRDMFLKIKGALKKE